MVVMMMMVVMVVVVVVVVRLQWRKVRENTHTRVHTHPCTRANTHRVSLPANSVVQLDACSLQNDPDLVTDHRAFRPERWLPEAVAARVGTPSEVSDHR
jgi:hypothetical protein